MRAFRLLSVLVIAFVGISVAAWEIRNPKANRATFYTHFKDVITFQKLQQFQE